jgi:hypothetical protein
MFFHLYFCVVKYKSEFSGALLRFLFDVLLVVEFRIVMLSLDFGKGGETIWGDKDASPLWRG